MAKDLGPTLRLRRNVEPLTLEVYHVENNHPILGLFCCAHGHPLAGRDQKVRASMLQVQPSAALRPAGATCEWRPKRRREPLPFRLWILHGRCEDEACRRAPWLSDVLRMHTVSGHKT